jgi:signal transduction histidine kinase
MMLSAQGLERATGHADAGIRERTARLVSQIRRLTGLIDALLDVSRISAGRLELAVEEVDLSQLAAEVVSRFGEAARHSGSVLRLQAPDRFAGRWDPLRVDQILTNLVSNAIKFGSGKPIDVTVEGTDALARVAVVDRGIGIPKEKIASVFDRFERAVPGRKYGGLGLGLYIAQQMAKAHGGRIDVESEPGQGATFVVNLPRRSDPIRS